MVKTAGRPRRSPKRRPGRRPPGARNDAEDQDDARPLGLNGLEVAAQRVGHCARGVADLDPLTERHGGFKKSIARRWMSNLHVSETGAGVFDHQRGNGWGLDDAANGVQINQDVKAASDACGHSARVAPAAAEELGVDRKHVDVSGHRQRTAVEPGIGPPKDRQSEDPGHALLTFQDIGCVIQHVARQEISLRPRASGVQVDISARSFDQGGEGERDLLGVLNCGACPGRCRPGRGRRGPSAAP